jgi:Na+/H+-dicarboxylate symporter
MFPKSIFQVLVQNGDFILPVCLLSVILGLTFEYDLNITEPVAAFFNSASRIFYWINSFIVEVISFLALVLAVSFLFQIRAINDIDFFRELLIILAILSFFIIVVMYPLLIYLLGGKKNPVKWLYAMLAPALAAFFSGDNYFSLAYLTKIGKESLGLPRRLNSAVFPIATVFARAGTAMVTCVSFVLILRSYSSLEISFIQLLWVMAFSFLISFLLGAVPGLAPILALSALSSLYGRGMEEGFLILKPAAPFLVSFAVLVDVFTAGFIGYLIGIREDMQTEIDSVEFA